MMVLMEGIDGSKAALQSARIVQPWNLALYVAVEVKVSGRQKPPVCSDRQSMALAYSFKMQSRGRL